MASPHVLPYRNGNSRRDTVRVCLHGWFNHQGPRGLARFANGAIKRISPDPLGFLNEHNISSGLLQITTRRRPRVRVRCVNCPQACLSKCAVRSVRSKEREVGLEARSLRIASEPVAPPRTHGAVRGLPPLGRPIGGKDTEREVGVGKMTVPAIGMGCGVGG